MVKSFLKPLGISHIPCHYSTSAVMSSYLVWTLLGMISINHTPCHYGNLVAMATRLKPLLFTPERVKMGCYCLHPERVKMGQGSRRASVSYPLKESKWERFKKESKMGCCCLPLDRVKLTVYSKKETNSRVKLGQGSRWASVIYPDRIKLTVNSKKKQTAGSKWAKGQDGPLFFTP